MNIINGITIEGDHKSISVVNGKIYLDDKLYDPRKKKKDDLYSLSSTRDEEEKEYYFNGTIVINGNVKKVDGTNITVNGDVLGDIDGTTVTVSGSVSGDVDGTCVTIKNQK